MTYGRLKSWAGAEDPEDLALFMSNEIRQIEDVLTQDSIKEDWYSLFISSVDCMIKAQLQKAAVNRVLDILCKTPFLDKHLTAFAMDKTCQEEWKGGHSFLAAMIRIFEEVLKVLPTHSLKIITAIPQLKSVADVHKLDDLASDVENLRTRASQIYKAGKEQPQSRFGLTSSGEAPPDDFLQLSVLPTCDDMKEDKNIFVRPAVLEGGYKDKVHYLDVQFRLMKQDFVIPLRKGINEFQKSGKKKHFSPSDLRMYYDVHILGIVTQSGIDHVLQFDVKKLKSVKWDFSKRLIFGSLVCLSKDGFETIAMATISNRDTEDLKRGFVNVNVKSGLDIVFNSTPEDEFVMAETVAFYESYCHVLEGLQEMCDNLPLQEHIVGCKKEVKPPQYLLTGRRSRLYDLSPFMKNTSCVVRHVLITKEWPSSEKMCLNCSQREAAQIALTKRLAVIQGPPGTGKTYVGLKVVETILGNHLVETDTPITNQDTPILVVCYTNHALDQFLEGILKFCDEGIIRVGGRSKSNILEPYNLTNIRSEMKKRKELSLISVERSRDECYRNLQELMEHIKETSKQMELIEFGVCSKEKLLSYDVMCEKHKESLLHGNQDDFFDRKKALDHWLNARIENPEKNVAKIIECNMARLILEGKFPTVNYKLSKDMGVEARAAFYHEEVQRLQSEYEARLFDLQELPQPPKVQQEIERIMRRLDICRRKIVPDHYFKDVMASETLDTIKQFLGETQVLYPDAVIKAWLLGLHKDKDEQLNDLERLHAKGSKPNHEIVHDLQMDDIKRVGLDFEGDNEFDKRRYMADTRALQNSFTAIMHRLTVIGLGDEDEQNATNDGDWQRVSWSKPLSVNKIKKKIKSTKKMTKAREGNVTNIWELDMNERFSLYKLWLTRCKSILIEQMKSLVEQYKGALAEKNEITGQETVSILRKAKVIGMTTTGAARHRSVLQTVGCRIIVVEEAAEVLESHIVTSLNKNCEHLILIGDHQQLRPSPVVYELAKNFGLEISLFERLVNNGFPHVVLQEQHRMRPEISNIMRHIYPDLKDHPVVYSHEHIQGVAKDVFLVQHKESETSVEDTRSRANQFEASYASKLSSYLLFQGYEPSQITILATYAGQIAAIKGHMISHQIDSEIRVTSVDNFQGEENDIIILSLVRSNEDKSIGFLKVDNRVCVALSRAKKGLFVIGNFELLSSQSKLWTQILCTAQKEGIVGDGLPVICSNHPDDKALMFRSEDFDCRPLGGCGLPCGYRLNCGHLCGLTCHGYDQLHEKYLCGKPCTKSCHRDHPCQKKCFEDCGDCLVKVPKVVPHCGHEDMIPCYLPPEDAICSLPCEEILEDCEHQCRGICGQCKERSKHALCTKRVQYLWPCGHMETVKCHQKPPEHPCPHPCEATLDCGHKCKGTCGACLKGKVHIACREPCAKKLPCGHPCSNYCSAPCIPCLKQCPSKCRHGYCAGKGTCGHICIPCKETCRRHCKCQKCSKLCSEICTNKPCSNRCYQKLNCGHTCSGMCGELCVCAACSEIHYLEVTVKPVVNEPSTEMIHHTISTENLPGVLGEPVTNRHHSVSSKLRQATSETTKSEDDKSNQRHRNSLLLKVPTCNHVFYVEELDQYVNNFEPHGSSFIPCPKCQTPIQKCSRYESINLTRAKKRSKLKRALLRESEVLDEDIEILVESKKALEASSALAPSEAGPPESASSELKNCLRNLNPSNAQYKSEILAMSLKLKLVFVLNEMDSFKPDTGEESEISDMLSTRADAILRIGKHLTSQQRRELISDFACCLCRAVVIKVKDICSNDGEDAPASLTDVIDSHGTSVQAGGLGKFLELTEASTYTFLESQRKSFASSNAPASALQCDVITKHLRTAFRVLQSDDTEVTFLNKKAFVRILTYIKV